MQCRNTHVSLLLYEEALSNKTKLKEICFIPTLFSISLVHLLHLGLVSITISVRSQLKVRFLRLLFFSLSDPSTKV